MSDSISLTVTQPDGSVVSISALLAGATITITPPPPKPPVIPATALVVDLLSFSGWLSEHDAGTKGDATGTTNYPSTAPDGTPNCRLFDFTNKDGGGYRYHGRILNNAAPYTHFCYHLNEYSADWSNVTCSEMDLERTDAQGHPLDMATQLDGYNGVVDVTISKAWKGTGIKVDPSKRTPGWHTSDVYVQDNSDGTVTYVGITLDGVYWPIGVTGPNKNMVTVWGANILNVQRQFDSKAAGPVRSQVYASQFQILCW